MKLLVDKEKYLVEKNGQEIDLPKLEFQLLWLLCSVPGKVFSHTEIFSKIWGEQSQSKPKTINVHLVNIRRKLGNDIFKTIKGVGYKINSQMIDITVRPMEAI